MFFLPNLESKTHNSLTKSNTWIQTHHKISKKKKKINVYILSLHNSIVAIILTVQLLHLAQKKKILFFFFLGGIQNCYDKDVVSMEKINATMR